MIFKSKKKAEIEADLKSWGGAITPADPYLNRPFDALTLEQKTALQVDYNDAIRAAQMAQISQKIVDYKHHLNPNMSTTLEQLGNEAELSEKSISRILGMTLDQIHSGMSMETVELFCDWFSEVHGMCLKTTNRLHVVKLDNTKQYILHVFEEDPLSSGTGIHQASRMYSAPPPKAYIFSEELTRKINMELKVQEYL